MLCFDSLCLDVIKDALDNGCKKCSQRQIDGSTKVIKYLYEHYRDQFDELKAKYDPEGKYIDKYREAATKEGIAL